MPSAPSVTGTHDDLDRFLDRPLAVRPAAQSAPQLRFEPDRKFASREERKSVQGNTQRPVGHVRPGVPVKPAPGQKPTPRPDQSLAAPEKPGRGRRKFTDADRKFMRAGQDQVKTVNRNIHAGVPMTEDLPPAHNKLRIIPIGGNEEVGRNMTVFEYGNDIVIVDMGVQFPEEDMPGVDYIVPNTSYL